MRLSLKSSPCYCRAEPKVVSIGFKQELPTPVRKPQPSRADASHSTGEEVTSEDTQAVRLCVYSAAPKELAGCSRQIQVALHLKGSPGKPWSLQCMHDVWHRFPKAAGCHSGMSACQRLVYEILQWSREIGCSPRFTVNAHQTFADGLV